MSRPPKVAQTPSEVIYRENKLRVLHYLPTMKRVLPVPIVIVSSLINKYYILDLLPGKSYVEYLVKQGFGVYMIDWGTLDYDDRTVTLEDHINGYLANIVSSVMKHARAKKISLIGYCMGGTMALMYAALHQRRVKNLVTLATPVDFHNDTLLSIWGRRKYFNVDKFIETYGNAPAEILYSTFMMLKPTKNITKYVDLLENMHNEEYVRTYLAFDYWINDAVPVAGETFRQFIKDTYQDNLLIQNRMQLGKRQIHLQNVKCSLLNVAAEHDEIVPLKSSTVLMDLIGSKDKELLTVKGGHHGLSIGPSARTVFWPKSVEWLKARSQG
ncbi:MAG: class III poly(R)-hydroxyalkanoic acid synthase subunit PhaC [Acidobacteria bacterium]|nr:class III poly(R)-hydroxyalkanoic acid synthase subunit PhaC [Acidobacteriota bacterium]